MLTYTSRYLFKPQDLEFHLFHQPATLLAIKMFGVIGFNDNDPFADYGPMVKKTTIVMMTLSGVVLALRFCSRRVARQPIKADDWLIIAGTILTWVMCLTEYKGMKKLLQLVSFTADGLPSR
jgi:hypothetical protein